MSYFAKADILKLGVAERIRLVEDIWDSIAEVPESVPLSDEDKAEPDRRLDAYHRDPDEGSPWGMVRDRIETFKSQALAYLHPDYLSQCAFACKAGYESGFED